MPDWDARYTETDKPFGNDPTAGVRALWEQTGGVLRSALCLADGDGRNGTWLASLGVAVTAVDLSPVATEKAFARDRAANVSVDRLVADVKTWAPGPERRWDAALMVFLQCEDAVRRRAAATAWAHLAPGGWFLAEGFSRTGAGTGGLGSMEPNVLYDAVSLRLALPGAEVIETLDEEVVLDEGVRHQGPAKVLRLIAKKPL